RRREEEARWVPEWIRRSFVMILSSNHSVCSSLFLRVWAFLRLFAPSLFNWLNFSNTLLTLEPAELVLVGNVKQAEDPHADIEEVNTGEAPKGPDSKSEQQGAHRPCGVAFG